MESISELILNEKYTDKERKLADAYIKTMGATDKSPGKINTRLKYAHVTAAARNIHKQIEYDKAHDYKNADKASARVQRHNNKFQALAGIKLDESAIMDIEFK